MASNVNRLRELINSDNPTLATRVFNTWPVITEAVGATGFYDYIEFSAEYAPFDQYDLENIARAAELHSLGSIIKVDYANRAYVSQKAICSGFQGILWTDHKTAEDVEATIKMVLSDSLQDGGQFGIPTRRLIGNIQGMRQMDFVDICRDVVKLFMIEKKAAFENIEEICSVDGVDMIQFGPSDFSMNSGFNFMDHMAEVREAEAKCIEVAIKHGVRPRAELMGADADTFKKYLDMGVKDFCVGGELWSAAAKWRNDGKAFRDFLEGNEIEAVKGPAHY
ncbi:MAG: aldolase/citrate lyase family protein [Oscillospiraceae bacterium]|nr:aldolase/citrate lyase family protein [Oscillospiraceae bacterium]